MPTGVESTGTSQARASTAASPKPSLSELTSTAAAALIRSQTVSGAAPPEGQQLCLDRVGDRERPIVALDRSGRVGGKEQIAAAGVEAESLPRLARGRGSKRPRSAPQGRTAARPSGKR